MKSSTRSARTANCAITRMGEVSTIAPFTRACGFIAARTPCRRGALQDDGADEYSPFAEPCVSHPIGGARFRAQRHLTARRLPAMQTTSERITIPVGGESMSAYVARPAE